MITGSSHLKYAKALYSVAIKKQQEENVLKELGHVSALFGDQHFLDMMKKISFASAEISAKTLDATFKGKVSEPVLNLLKMLSHAKKIELFPKIASAYRQTFHLEKGIDDVTVRCARLFSPEEQKKFIEKLQSQKKRPLSVRFEENPELIGGVQIYERGYLQDFSVQHYLQSVEKFLMSQELDALSSASEPSSSSPSDSAPTQTQLF